MSGRVDESKLRPVPDGDSVLVPVTMHWTWGPAGLIAVLAVPAVIWTVLLPPDSFPVSFGQPAFMDSRLRWIAISFCLILLAVGAIASTGRGGVKGFIKVDAVRAHWLDQVVRALAAITIGAYAVWFLLALAKGLNLGVVRALLAGDPGTMYELRNNYFGSVGGVTTWMQLGALVVPFALLRAKAGVRPARRLVLTLFALALVRALLNSERLALLEIAVSSILAWLILRPEPPRVVTHWWGVVAIFLGVWGSLFLSFAVFEFFRSWATVRASYDGSFISYVQNLLVGYYATALNNAAFDHFLLAGARLPSVMFDGDIYRSLFGVSPISSGADAYGIETYTNRSGLLTPFVAFGAVGGAFVIFAVAVVMTTLARRIVRGGMIAFAVYAGSAIGLLEIARIFYFGSSRFLPIAIIGLVLPIWLKLAERSAGGVPLVSGRREPTRLSSQRPSTHTETQR